jgi:hypothetical protein
VDGLVYVFTKEYRQRPDSIKRIPTLKQLEMVGGVWTRNGAPYHGPYIDYYNSGRIQNRATCSTVSSIAPLRSISRAA